jgi:hypothetical protein
MLPSSILDVSHGNVTAESLLELVSSMSVPERTKVEYLVANDNDIHSLPLLVLMRLLPRYQFVQGPNSK